MRPGACAEGADAALRGLADFTTCVEALLLDVEAELYAAVSRMVDKPPATAPPPVRVPRARGRPGRLRVVRRR